MSVFRFKPLGVFDVPSGRLVVADPVYLNNKDWGRVIRNAKPGRWIALAEIGPVVASVFVFHESDAVRATNDDRGLHFNIGVDSGRACIVDSESSKGYEDADLSPGFKPGPFGLMVPTGFGDGIYSCWLREYAGETVSVHVRFFDWEACDE